MADVQLSRSVQLPPGIELPLYRTPDGREFYVEHGVRKSFRAQHAHEHYSHAKQVAWSVGRPEVKIPSAHYPKPPIDFAQHRYGRKAPTAWDVIPMVADPSPIVDRIIPDQPYSKLYKELVAAIRQSLSVAPSFTGDFSLGVAGSSAGYATKTKLVAAPQRAPEGVWSRAGGPVGTLAGCDRMVLLYRSNLAGRMKQLVSGLYAQLAQNPCLFREGWRLDASQRNVDAIGHNGGPYTLYVILRYGEWR